MIGVGLGSTGAPNAVNPFLEAMKRKHVATIGYAKVESYEVALPGDFQAGQSWIRGGLQSTEHLLHVTIRSPR